MFNPMTLRQQQHSYENQHGDDDDDNDNNDDNLTIRTDSSGMDTLSNYSTETISALEIEPLTPPPRLSSSNNKWISNRAAASSPSYYTTRSRIAAVAARGVAIVAGRNVPSSISPTTTTLSPLALPPLSGNSSGVSSTSSNKRITTMVVTVTFIVTISVVMNFIEGSVLKLFVIDPSEETLKPLSSSFSNTFKAATTGGKSKKAKFPPTFPPTHNPTEQPTIQPRPTVQPTRTKTTTQEQVQNDKDKTHHDWTSANTFSKSTSWLTYQSQQRPLPKRNKNRKIRIGNGTQFAEQWCDLSLKGTGNGNDQQLHWYPTINGTKEWQYRTPYFILPGAANAGTTYLAAALHQHPRIYAARTKELQFFYDHAFSRFIYKVRIAVNDTTTSSSAAATTKKNVTTATIERTHVATARTNMYAIHYPTSTLQNATTAISFDATSGYLFASSVVPRRILCVTPWVKIVLVLRNPVDRILSHYKQAITQRNLRKSIVEWINEEFALLIDTGFLPANATTIKTAEYIPTINTTESSTSTTGSKYYSLTDNLNDKNVTLRVPIWNSEDEFYKFYGKPDEDIRWNEYYTRTVEGVIGRSIYCVQLRQWFATMQAAGRDPSTDVLLLFNDDLVTNPQAVYNTTLRFLSLPPHKLVFPSNTSADTSTNASSTSKSTPSSSSDQLPNLPILSNKTLGLLTPEMRSLLEEFFQPYTNQLVVLLHHYKLQ